MAETHANLFRTTVGAGGITDAATSLPVAAAAPVRFRGFEARCLVGTSAQLGDGSAEIMLATIPADGLSPWVVARAVEPEGRPAVAHVAGEEVALGALTAGSLRTSLDRSSTNFRYVARSGRYFVSGDGLISYASVTTGNGFLLLMPFIVGSETTWDRLACEIVTAASAGGLIRQGIYADTGGAYPGALVLDAGTVDVTTTGIKEATISQVLPPGLYWVGGAVQGAPATTPVVRGPALPAAGGSAPGYTSPIGKAAAGITPPQHGYYQAAVTGALPSTFTATVIASANVQLVWMRAV